MKELYRYQEEGVRFLKAHRHALLADDMGLGKTAQAIVAAKELNALKILVICPTSVQLNWEREMREWYPERWNIHIVRTSNEYIPENASVVITNYSLIIRNGSSLEAIRSRGFSVGICDEAHYLKSIDSQRSKAVLGKEGVLRNCYYKWVMTGTPVLNRPVELFPLLSTLTLGKVKSYKSYVDKFCGAYTDVFGRLNVSGATHIPELSAMLDDFMLRRMKEDVMDQLPKTVYQKIEVPITPAIEAILEMEENLLAEEYTEFEIFATLRRETALAKLPECISFIKEILESKNKVVVFAYHRDVIEKLEVKFEKLGVSKIYGGMSIDKRQDAINAFRKDARVFIGQVTAAGQGVDGLQDVCDTVIFVEPMWTSAERDQAVDRLIRLGQKSQTVFVYELVAEGTVESTMRRTVNRKEKVIKELI